MLLRNQLSLVCVVSLLHSCNICKCSLYTTETSIVDRASRAYSLKKCCTEQFHQLIAQFGMRETSISALLPHIRHEESVKFIHPLYPGMYGIFAFICIMNFFVCLDTRNDWRHKYVDLQDQSALK